VSIFIYGLFNDVASSLLTDGLINELLIGNDEGNGRGIYQDTTWRLPGGTEEIKL
jgi:hypothetical protein